MRPAAQMWEAAWIGLPVMAIILIGFFTNMKLPFGIPVGLAALLVGTAIGWIGGFMSAPDVGQAVSDIAIGIPDLRLDMLFSGLSDLAPLLGTAIPLGVYNFTEAMSNVESAAAAGDNYNLRSVLLADGAGAVVGSAFGSPFPPAVYIGHPGLEGRRRPGRLLAGQRRRHRNPLFPRAFRRSRRAAAGSGDRADPALHRAADRGAGVPGGAAAARRGGRRRDPAEPRAVGQRADRQRAQRRGHVGDRGRAWRRSTVRAWSTRGLQTLGEGAVLVGLILGTMVTFILEKKFLYAAIASAVGAVLSFIGLIHAPEVAWAANPQVALGYVFFGIVCAGVLVPARRQGPGGGRRVRHRGGPLIRPVPRNRAPVCGGETPPPRLP